MGFSSLSGHSRPVLKFIHQLTLHRNISSQTITWLLFNGLDTFTSISFCGPHVASNNNQFREYYFDISSILSSCTGTPELTIKFGSAVNMTEKIANEPGQET